MFGLFRRYPSGESYLDVIQRLEPVVIEMEREREYIMVVGHQVRCWAPPSDIYTVQSLQLWA
jgi:broad specificity phosphatase PhoE